MILLNKKQKKSPYFYSKLKNKYKSKYLEICFLSKNVFKSFFFLLFLLIKTFDSILSQKTNFLKWETSVDAKKISYFHSSREINKFSVEILIS